MLGKLELDESIVMLKKLAEKIPFNLYDLSSKEERDLSLIIQLIKQMYIPERLENIND